METARIAALRGHEVFFNEKRNRLGVYLIEASIPSHKRDIKPLLAWMALRVKKADVHIALGNEVGPELVAELEPDAVIVALGVDPIIPKIPGVDKPMTVGAMDVLSDKATVGKRVVVAGGGLVGCDVAAYPAERGKEVAIVEELQGMARRVEIFDGSRGALLLMLDQKGVVSFTDTKLVEITDQGAVVILIPTLRMGMQTGLSTSTAVAMAPESVDSIHPYRV